MSKYKVQTFTGKLVDYLDPNPETICIEDIAKGLSQECRFMAQSSRHESVAYHSILMCGLMPADLKLEGLLHDAEEAYIKDLSPHLVGAIGRGMVNQYRFIKRKFQKVILTKFLCRDFNEDYINEKYDFIGTIEGFIKKMDNRVSITERNSLFKEPNKYPEYWYNAESLPMLIAPQAIAETEKKFLEMFELYRRDK